MNRLHHLQQTLEKNIQDNFLPNEVEFVLLDYNSTDGLEEWVRKNVQKYIDEEILVYYRTVEPTHYLRSHSRNMAFRLANAEILCNLDADNFLGKGFAGFMLQEFAKHDNIFYPNDHSYSDTFGRICVRAEDFIWVRGYNEDLKGYGYEDNDFQNRLSKYGLKPIIFRNPDFYHFVQHSDTQSKKRNCVSHIEQKFVNNFWRQILSVQKKHYLCKIILRKIKWRLLANISDNYV